MLDERVRRVLARLEAEDERDSAASLPVSERSLAVPPGTGALLYALCSRQPGCAVLEIGGSRGYSTLWLGAATRRAGGRLTSLEVDPHKLEVSAANFAAAGLERWIDVVPGDALRTLRSLEGPFDVVFLDAWKDDYEILFQLVLPLVATGGLVVADNVLSHADGLAAYSRARQSDPALLSLTLPLDNGVELSTVLTGGLHSG